MYETLTCEGCYRTWTRTVTRGRKPRTCEFCRGYVKLPPRHNVSHQIKVQYTDGGRSGDGYTRETNDCTVRALAVATGSTYADAHAFLKANGRKPRKGIVHRNGRNMLGHKLTYVNLNRAKGLKTALLRNPLLKRGTWILHSTRHVAVLKNGVLFDSFDSSRKIIDGAWKVERLHG